MTDYLDRLVARGLEPLEAIRPRPVARFETGPAETALVAGAGASGADEMDRPGAPRRRSRAEPPSPRPEPEPRPASERRAPWPIDAVAAVPRAAPRREPVPAPTAPPRLRLGAVVDSPSAQASPAVPSALTRTRGPAPPGEVVVPPPAAASHREVAAGVGPAPHVRHERAVARVTDVSLPAPAPPPERLAPPDAPAAELPRRKVMVEPPPPAAEPRAQPAPMGSVRPVARVRRDDVADREAAATPTIHVTIGRVEVRASSAGVPKPRRQPTGAPVMGLDEYLRQRAGGGTP